MTNDFLELYFHKTFALEVFDVGLCSFWIQGPVWGGQVDVPECRAVKEALKERSTSLLIVKAAVEVLIHSRVRESRPHLPHQVLCLRFQVGGGTPPALSAPPSVRWRLICLTVPH